MAYIDREEDENPSGMDVLAPQNQQALPEQQNQGSNASQGQSATIGSGQNQGTAQPKSKAPKSTSSGMFQNLQKYIQQNKQSANRMSQSLQKNVSDQNANIQNAINKQQSDFMSRVNANRQRMQDAQQFGQQAVQQAQSQQSMPMLQQQQQDLQQELQAYQPVTDQTQQIGQYQTDIANQQTTYDQNVAAYNQAQQAFQQQAQGFIPTLDALGQIQSGTEQVYGRWQPNYIPTYYTQDQINQALMSGDPNAIASVEQAIQTNLENAPQTNMYGVFNHPTQEQQYQEAQARMDAFQQYKQNLEAQTLARQAQEESLNKLTGLQDSLSRSQEEQRLFQNKQNLEAELAGIQDKIDNAPEELTEQDIERFNNIRTGIERFDQEILNLSTQRREVEDLQRQAESLGTSAGRRQLMRQEFGRQGGYTAGQSSLDNLILTGNREALANTIQGAREQAQSAKARLDEAFAQGKISQDELAIGTRQLQEQLNTQVSDAESALQADMEARAASGEGSYMNELRRRLESGQGLTQEDYDILGLTGQERFNVDPTSLLSKIDPNHSIQDVANLTDVARAQALARLSGKDQQTMLLDEGRIRDRFTRAGEEDFTTSRADLGQADQQAVAQFKSQLLDNLKYGSVDEARSTIQQNIINRDPNIEPVAGMIQSLVENGQTGWEFGTVDLNTLLGDDLEKARQEAGKISHTNYWSWAGRGRHGVAFNPDDIIRLTRQMYNETSDVVNSYSSGQDNAIRRSGESKYAQADQVKDRLS